MATLEVQGGPRLYNRGTRAPSSDSAHYQSLMSSFFFVKLEVPRISSTRRNIVQTKNLCRGPTYLIGEVRVVDSGRFDVVFGAGFRSVLVVRNVRRIGWKSIWL